eukprot:TRINITY_DN16311_c0_g1_i1.p1 TRINITY_DN16311_c0_g1~~TRINITY_DN16311_c0_g1_i1.p1  ORF type:complete len:657 (-),score=102.84 TRINITY_DN16311_c0_g1_i1:64-2034(-)
MNCPRPQQTHAAMPSFSEQLAVLAAEYKRLEAENELLRAELQRWTCEAADILASPARVHVLEPEACHAGLPPGSNLNESEATDLSSAVHHSDRNGSETRIRSNRKSLSMRVQQRQRRSITQEHGSKECHDNDSDGGEVAVTQTRSRRMSLVEQWEQLQQSVNDVQEEQEEPADAKRPHASLNSMYGGGGMLNLGDMKAKIKEQMLEPAPYDVTTFYKTTGWCQHVARHPLFENITMGVIAVYAVWMAVDADWNPGSSISDTPVIFVFFEQTFCVFFTLELVIRFGAFESKRNCPKDAWFMFDTLLVILMLVENYILGFMLGSMVTMASNAGLLRLARLMRMTRLFRMVRLLKFVPELLIMIKAIMAASRAVCVTLMLLVAVTYVFGIAFKQILTGTEVGDARFSSVLMSMHTLTVHGALMDDISDLMRALFQESALAFCLMYVVYVITAITVMNMLIGILCEVINAVAGAEKEALQVRMVRDTLQVCLLGSDVDKDGSGSIDQDEFMSMFTNDTVLSSLEEMGVDPLSLYEFADVIFEDADCEADGKMALSFPYFMEVLLQLRGSNTATVKDLVDMRKWLSTKINQLGDNKVRQSDQQNGHLNGNRSLHRTSLYDCTKESSFAPKPPDTSQPCTLPGQAEEPMSPVLSPAHPSFIG